MGIFDKQGAYQEFKPLFTAQFDVDKTVDKLNKAYETVDNTYINATTALTEEQPFANKIRDDYNVIKDKVAEGTLSPFKAVAATKAVANAYANDPLRRNYELSYNQYNESLKEAGDNPNKDKAAKLQKNTFLYDFGGSKNGAMQKFGVAKFVEPIDVVNKGISDIAADKVAGISKESVVNGSLRFDMRSDKGVTKQRVKAIYDGVIKSDPGLQEQFKLDAYDEEHTRMMIAYRAQGYNETQANALAHKAITTPNKQGKTVLDASIEKKNLGVLQAMVGKAVFHEVEQDVKLHDLGNGEGDNMYFTPGDVGDVVSVTPDEFDNFQDLASETGFDWSAIGGNISTGSKIVLNALFNSPGDPGSTNTVGGFEQMYRTPEEAQKETFNALVQLRDAYPQAKLKVTSDMTIPQLKAQAERVNKYFALHAQKARVFFTDPNKQKFVSEHLAGDANTAIKDETSNTGFISLDSYIDELIKKDSSIFGDKTSTEDKREKIKKSLSVGGLTTTHKKDDSYAVFDGTIAGRKVMVKGSTAIDKVSTDLKAFNQLATNPTLDEVKLSNGEKVKKEMAWDDAKKTFVMRYNILTSAGTPTDDGMYKTIDQMSDILSNKLRTNTLGTSLRDPMSSSSKHDKVKKVNKQ